MDTNIFTRTSRLPSPYPQNTRPGHAAESHSARSAMTAQPLSSWGQRRVYLELTHTTSSLPQLRVAKVTSKVKSFPREGPYNHRPTGNCWNHLVQPSHDTKIPPMLRKPDLLTSNSGLWCDITKFMAYLSALSSALKLLRSPRGFPEPPSFVFTLPWTQSDFILYMFSFYLSLK